jgi:O-antigen ligase
MHATDRLRGRAAIAALAVAVLIVAVEIGWARGELIRPLRWQVTITAWGVVGSLAVRSARLSRHLTAPQLLPLHLWLGWNLVAVLWADDIRNSLLVTGGLVVVAIAGIWFATAYGWRAVCLVVAWTGAVFLVAGLVAHALGYPQSEAPRLIGLAKNYTDAGVHAALAMPLGYWLYRRRHVGLAALFVALGLAVALLSDARMATFAMLLAFALAEIEQGNRVTRPITRVAAVAVVAFGLLTLIGGLPTDQFVARDADQRDITTFTGRSDIWAEALDQVWRTPAFGIGSKDNTAFFERAAEDGDIPTPSVHAHNTLLETTLEHGLPGGLLLVASGVAYVATRRRYPIASRDGVVAVVMIVGITESLLHEASLAMFLFAAAIASTTLQGDDARRSATPTPARVVAPA